MSKNRQKWSEMRSEQPDEQPDGGRRADDGIEYADESPDAAPAPATPEAAPSSDEPIDLAEVRRRNDMVARQVIEGLRHADLNVLAPQRRAPMLPKLPPAEEVKLRARWYEVLEERKLPNMILRQGKRISENDFKIPDLIRMGVKLREIELP